MNLLFFYIIVLTCLSSLSAQKKLPNAPVYDLSDFEAIWAAYKQRFNKAYNNVTIEDIR